MTWTMWLLIAAACAAIEIGTAGFWFLWLAVAGALTALLVRVGILVGLPAQILVFSAASLLLIVFTRPLLLRLVRTNEVKSNVDSIAGQVGVVIEDIKPILGQGLVKLGGEVWSAKADHEIASGTSVVVREVQGVKLIVEEAR